MIADNRCAECIHDDLLGALTLLRIAKWRKGRILIREIFFLMEEFRDRRVPSYYITKVHRIIKEESGIPIPFASLRNQCNIAGMALAEKVDAKAQKLSGKKRFEFLVRWAIAGNHLDFRTIGAGYGIETGTLEKTMAGIARERLSVGDIAHIYNSVRRARHILFLHDNVGEIALDRLLIKEMKVTGRGSPVVVSALKGGPITSDATVEDGVSVGLGTVSKKLIRTGPDTLGVSWEEMSGDLKRELLRADLVISKGQANYYVLSEHRKEIRAPVAFLLRTKCSVVARQFGVPGGKGKHNLAALDQRVRRGYFSGETAR